MTGRIYVTCDKENNVCIKYYDYDNIDKDGYNFVHIISFIRDDRELFDKIYYLFEYDGPYIKKEFRFENSWDDLIKYLKTNKVKYSYEKLKLSKEERLKTQQDQSSIQRDVYVSSRAQECLNAYMNMNEFERKMYLRQCKELIESFDNGQVIQYECSVDYDDDEFVFMEDKDKYYDEIAMDNCENPEDPIYLEEYNNLPEAIKSYVDKWHTDGVNACKYVSWEAKNAIFTFIYQNKRYELYPSAMNLDHTQVDHISNEIEDDLKEIGCKCIAYFGMLD